MVAASRRPSALAATGSRATYNTVRSSIGAGYATLDRLVEKGYLRARDTAGGPERAGQPKRYFSITPRGISALEDARALQARMWHGIQLEKGRKA